ncbi:MAG TPA: response regulator, partial [Candidatus Binataceae bacterium]
RAAKVNESPDEATLRFEVRDTGIGIAAEEQTQIFRAFTQVGDRRHEGTGLGLAIASRLVEQMGGSIGVLSAPGAGSTFWFTANFGKSSIAVVSKTAAFASKLGLPPAITGVGAPAIIGDAAALEFAGASGRKPRILLAEDNASNRKVALWQLDKLGCSADVVTNGVEALEALARSAYDVVLMDCRMPQMDGNEATRQIRRREGSARHTWIVAMTAHAMEQDKKKCLEAGMDDYLTKPVTLESLANTLRRVLGEKADPASSPPRAIAEPPPDAVPAPVVDAVPAPVVDAATMASLRAKGDLLPGLIDTVMVEIPEQLTEIGDALARRDFAGAAVAAHSLRGTARLFGAARMDELAAAVEQAADEEETETAAAQLQRLGEECGRVTGELRIERANPALQIH